MCVCVCVGGGASRNCSIPTELRNSFAPVLSALQSERMLAFFVKSNDLKILSECLTLNVSTPSKCRISKAKQLNIFQFADPKLDIFLF